MIIWLGIKLYSAFNTENYFSLFVNSSFHLLRNIPIKIAVQFETEGNGQNDIVSHMDRLKVKL